MDILKRVSPSPVSRLLEWVNKKSEFLLWVGQIPPVHQEQWFQTRTRIAVPAAFDLSYVADQDDGVTPQPGLSGKRVLAQENYTAVHLHYERKSGL